MESGDCFCQSLFVCCINHLYIQKKIFWGRQFEKGGEGGQNTSGEVDFQNGEET